MNDLAEKALHGLDVARRAVVARPMLAFGVVGFAMASAVVAGRTHRGGMGAMASGSRSIHTSRSAKPKPA